MKTNKTLKHAKTFIMIGLTAITILTSCHKKNDHTTFEIPLLLSRNANLNDSVEVVNIKNRYNKALKELALKKDSSDALLDITEILMNEARITGEHPYYYPQAQKTINYVLKNKNLSTDLKFRALTAKSSIEMSLHHFEDALKTANEAVLLNPYNAGIYGVLVDANVELGKYPEAIKFADKMVSIRPDLRSYSRISYLREIHGDIPGAIDAMQMAVEAGFPGHEATAWAGYTLGKLLENYGDTAKSRQVYSGVLLERPNYAFAIAGLGSLSLKSQDYLNAEKYVNQAIAIMPEVSFYHILADIKLAKGDNAEAQKIGASMLTMIQEDEASGHEMSLEKAYVYLELLNNPKQALTSVQNEYKVRPFNIDVNRCLAEIYAHQKQWSTAKFHMEKALITGSKLPKAIELNNTIASQATSDVSIEKTTSKSA